MATPLNLVGYSAKRETISTKGLAEGYRHGH